MKFKIKFYRPEQDEPYKKITVNQDILVTNAIQTEAKDLTPFIAWVNVEEFSLYLYFTNNEIQVNKQLAILANWLNGKRWEHD